MLQLPAAELIWLRESRTTNIYAWIRDGDETDVWPCVPVLSSVGGGGGIFIVPATCDLPNSSPEALPDGTLSRQKVGATFLEILREGWGEMRPWTPAVQAVEGKARARVQQFTHGTFPRANEILK